MNAIILMAERGPGGELVRLGVENRRILGGAPETGMCLALQLRLGVLPDGQSTTVSGLESGTRVLAAIRMPVGEWNWAPLSESAEKAFIDMLTGAGVAGEFWYYLPLEG